MSTWSGNSNRTERDKIRSGSFPPRSPHVPVLSEDLKKTDALATLAGAWMQSARLGPGNLHFNLCQPRVPRGGQSLLLLMTSSFFYLVQAIFKMINPEDLKNLPDDENTPEKRAEKIWGFFGKKDDGEFLLLHSF